MGLREKKYFNRDVKRQSFTTFCAHECALDFKRIPVKQCLECHQPFHEGDIRRKFCSRHCSALSSNRVRNPECRKKQGRAVSDTMRKLYAEGILQAKGGRTKWLRYQDIKVQGTFELRTCHILDQWKASGKIADWEYTNDRVPYVNVDGKSSTYLFDFKVWRNDGSIFYIEVKGFVRANDPLKWDAARGRGLEVVVWFEKEISEFEKI